MIQLTKREINKLNTRKAKVAKLNKDLREYFDVSGDMSLPDIECTCIGYSPMGMVEANDIKDEKGNVIGFKATVDDIDYNVEFVEEDGDIYFTS